MDVLIVGSVALDNVRTPFGEVNSALGGSAVYSSLAAGYFSQVGLVGVVGQDFPEDHLQLLSSRQIRLEGLERSAGKTFRWSGYYEYDMSSAHTLETQLNVFASFEPKIPEPFRNAPYLFLANIDPVLQARVLEQVRQPRFVLLDTMNYWIETKKAALLKVIQRVDMIIVNDAEARQLAGTPNLLQAARWLRQQGPRGVVIKKGEHGALVFWEEQMIALPAFPLEVVKDPTGAGDSFAGGFIGSLAALGDLSPEGFRTAASVGTVLASFTVEDFSVRGLAGLDEDRIRQRYDSLRELTRLSELPRLNWRRPVSPPPK